jgi:hypothetical protein
MIGLSDGSVRNLSIEDKEIKEYNRVDCNYYIYT